MKHLFAALAAHVHEWRGRSRYVNWNSKALGSALARQLYESGRAGAGLPCPPEPVAIGITGGLCRQAEIESDWLRHWCGQIGMAPIYHRKVWEDCFVVQALWEAGALAPGQRGLGFAVGSEALPAFLAARGAQIVATDLDASHRRAQHWISMDQHGADREGLYHPHLIDRATFDSRVQQRAVDMNAIPADLHGQFDFCWSVCALEHLGSVEHGMRFVENAMRCLRPGGIAVHTTEFNLDPGHGRLHHGATVLFEREHIETLLARLAAAGHQPAPVDFSLGDGVLDGFIDTPPYNPRGGRPAAMPVAPHLRLQVKGIAASSIGLIVRKGDAPMQPAAPRLTPPDLTPPGLAPASLKP